MSIAIERYSRQLLLAEVGPAGQHALAQARVTVVGAGGLAAPILSYLAAAGVGHLTVIDSDHIEVSNLHRQVLYGVEDVGKPKADVAASRIAALLPDTQITAVTERLNARNARHWLAADVVVDATDNFPTRFLINDACRLAKIPLVHGAVTRFSGLLTTFSPDGPCYRCFFPEPPEMGRIPGCSEVGVLGPAVGTVGSLQALEVVKWIVGRQDQCLVGRLLTMDLLAMTFETIALPRDPACPLCGPHPFIVDIDPLNPHYEQVLIRETV